MSDAEYISGVASIVLVNGPGTTALTWEHWVERYSEQGYQVVARSWPSNPSSIAKPGLAKVAGHYERIICELDEPPIIIGHGVGGLVTQILLDRGWGAAGVGSQPRRPKDVPASVLHL